MKAQPLHSLAVLSTGLYLQGSPEANARYIQARHFDGEGTFDARIQPEVHLEARQSRHLLLPGDILFASKGQHHFAVQYQTSMGRAVASSIFLVIRLISPTQVLPAYLTWYLNHPDTQARLKTHVRTATVASLTMQTLAGLVIPVPPLAKQSTLLQVDELRRKERTLQRELQSLRESRIQNLLLQSLR